jgi:hypothetical protein
MAQPPATTAASTALVPRERFLSDLRDACEHPRAYAAGKLGGTERAALAHPIVLELQPDATKRTAFELVTCYRALKASGLFPAEPQFYGKWSRFYCEQVAALDSIGVSTQLKEESLALLRYHLINSAGAIDYKHHQPDRSSTSASERCYLSFFADRDVLLICLFAEFLAERATKTTFERVWAKTDKRWFHPRTVQALELPYGFAATTQARYETAFELLEDVKRQVAGCTFDVALIAAGCFGIPLAAFVKQQGRIAISLGGHLQVLFGVLGARWRSNPRWRARYFNEAWVDLPERYHPAENESSENYW